MIAVSGSVARGLPTWHGFVLVELKSKFNLFEWCITGIYGIGVELVLTPTAKLSFIRYRRL